MRLVAHLPIFICLLVGSSVSFTPPSTTAAIRRRKTTTTALLDKDLQRDIEERSRRNAQGGMGETAAGAVLGGLLLGPFGALFGASVGSNLGAKNSLERARKEEMDRLGITQEMLDAAEDIGLALERSIDGLKASQDSLETLQRLARKLDSDAEAAYDQAKAALAESNEERAREFLLQRTTIQDKLKKVLLQCADEKGRLEKMESNVSALEERAMEINSLLKRSVGARTLQEADSIGLSLKSEDPLLQKFRDAGIE